MAGFFTLDEGENDEPELGRPIGEALVRANSSRKKIPVDTDELQKVGDRTGFSRMTGQDFVAANEVQPRRGRPPRNEEMTYWRVYIKPSLRDKLSKLRDERGVRMNDLIEAMYESYGGE